MSLEPRTPPVKRYFTTNTLHNQYPPEFVESQNPKYVHVIGCKLFGTVGSVAENVKTVQPLDFVELHASFIQDKPYLNGFVCYCNETLVKRKKYQQFGKVRDFKIWFQNYDGKLFDWHNKNKDSYFILELMLEY
jgi:hypothetical protein